MRTNSTLNPEERRQQAMSDPEIQSILMDPAMRMILEQMQENPQAVAEYVVVVVFVVDLVGFSRNCRKSRKSLCSRKFALLFYLIRINSFTNNKEEIVKF